MTIMLLCLEVILSAGFRRYLENLEAFEVRYFHSRPIGGFLLVHLGKILSLEFQATQ